MRGEKGPISSWWPKSSPSGGSGFPWGLMEEFHSGQKREKATKRTWKGEKKRVQTSVEEETGGDWSLKRPSEDYVRTCTLQKKNRRKKKKREAKGARCKGGIYAAQSLDDWREGGE